MNKIIFRALLACRKNKDHVFILSFHFSAFSNSRTNLVMFGIFTSLLTGVKTVTVESQKDLVTVIGTMDAKELVPYLNVKLKRTVAVVPPKKDDAGGDKKEKGGDGGGEKKKEGGGEKKEGDGKASGGEKKEGDGKAAAGGEKKEGDAKLEVNKMEYYGYGYPPPPQYWYQPPPAFNQGYEYPIPAEGPSHWYGGQVYGQGYNGAGPSHHGYVVQHMPSPQIFSDENPNACSVM